MEGTLNPKTKPILVESAFLGLSFRVYYRAGGTRPDSGVSALNPKP